MAKNKQDTPPGEDKSFPGFDIPRQNWFKLPNNWTDLTAEMNSWSEQKVVEYVLRHTWGYQEFGELKKISLDEFQNGRKRKDGSRIDKGIGMGKQAIINGIKQAVKDGFLIEEKDDSDRGRVKKYYGLRMLASLDKERGGYDNHTSGVRSSYSRGMIITHRSEKDTIERHSTVNGGQNFIKDLPNLDQSLERTEYVAQYILDQLGDDHSAKFYKLVAAKVPEPVIRKALAEIKADGARNPAKVFTHRMKLYALEQLKTHIGK